MKQKIVYVAVIFSIALSAHVGPPRPALSQESFFQDKTITIIQGRDPGGSASLESEPGSRSREIHFRQTPGTSWNSCRGRSSADGVIREVPRDPEAVDLFKRLANTVALPSRR